jgi:hypothetical protein
MTPIWVPLVVAVVALAGVIWTQHAADRRAKDDRKDAREREDSRLSAEAAQRQIEWERTQRLDAHAQFLAEQWKAEHHMTMYNQVGTVEAPAPDWTEPMARQLNVVSIFGSDDSARAATSLLRLTGEMASGSWGVGRYLELDAAKEQYIAAVQRDLGVRETAPVRFYGDDAVDAVLLSESDGPDEAGTR